MKPTIIGIGAQKCASSWVHTIMGTHPEVGVSDPKELDFFSYYFDRGYAWYESFFEGCEGKPQAFESSPSYFYDPRTPERVMEYDPSIKIVALLRDPVQRAYSNHLHEVIKGHIGPVSFAEGLRNNPVYVEQGRYHKHLSHWLSIVPKEQVLVMLAEDISADPDAAISELYRFAGIDDSFRSQVHGERRNESDRARSPAMRKVLRAGGDFLRKQGLEEHLARVKSAGPVASLLAANSVDIRKEIPPMDAESQARLDVEFAPEITALAQLLGRSSLPWGTWERVAA